MTTTRILVIDDEADIRAVVQVTLELTAGWEVLTAGSGREGLTVAAAAGPDAILLDVMMPDMDGPTTAQHLRAAGATRHIPIVLLTARVQAADRRAFAKLGVAGLIEKPFDPMTLAEQIATLLGRDR